MTGRVAAEELDVAEAALGEGAAGGEEGVEEGGEGGDGVGAGTGDLAGDEDLDGAELAEVYGEIEVAVDAGELGLEEGGKLTVAEAGDVDRADVGDGDVSGAVDDEGPAGG